MCAIAEGYDDTQDNINAAREISRIAQKTVSEINNEIMSWHNMIIETLMGLIFENIFFLFCFLLQ